MGVYKLPTNSWYLERIIFLIAGLMILISLGLGVYVNELFFVIIILVGISMLLFSLSGYCPMAILLSRCGVDCRMKYKEEEIK